MIFELLARYNQWANKRLTEDLTVMDEQALRSPTDANFGSIIGILNHLLLADAVWLNRFTGKGEPPDAIDIILYGTLSEFALARQAMDEQIIAFAAALDPVNNDTILDYANMRGRTEIRKNKSFSDTFLQPSNASPRPGSCACRTARCGNA